MPNGQSYSFGKNNRNPGKRYRENTLSYQENYPVMEGLLPLGRQPLLHSFDPAKNYQTYPDTCRRVTSATFRPGLSKRGNSFTQSITNMKQLQVSEMETVLGGKMACLEAGLVAMEILSETGVGALLGGIIAYSACSLF